MANVFKVAKSLQRKHPQKFANWQKAVKAAGKEMKKKPSPKKTKPKKKAMPKKKNTRTGPSKSRPSKKTPRTLMNQAKGLLEEKAGTLYTKITHHAKGSRAKKKLRKQLNQINSEIRKLS